MYGGGIHYLGQVRLGAYMVNIHVQGGGYITISYIII
jgi:hypothetical protein